MGKAQPSGPSGFEQVLPSAATAKGWNNLNRKHRRSSIAKMQAGVPAHHKEISPGVFEFVPKRVRLVTQARKVQYARMLAKEAALKAEVTPKSDAEHADLMNSFKS